MPELGPMLHCNLRGGHLHARSLCSLKGARCCSGDLHSWTMAVAKMLRHHADSCSIRLNVVQQAGQ